MKYKVVLHRSADGVSVCVPMLPGCWSEGDTEQEALANIQDAIREHLAALNDRYKDAEIRTVEVPRKVDRHAAHQGTCRFPRAVPARPGTLQQLAGLGRWFAGLGLQGVQIPAWDRRIIDLDQAADSPAYCDDFRARLAALGLEATELAGYLQGQVLAVHPAFELGFAGFHPPGLTGAARTEWAAAELAKCIRASARLGLRNIPVLSGGFAWHLAYPWPQRPAGLIDEAFRELARRWRPLLDLARENGCVFGYELHPGSDLFDGATFERFLEHTKDHAAACLNYDPSHFLLQQLDYLQFIQLYGNRIAGFHVKDAEFRPSGRVGVYGGYESWAGRAGRFRSLGDGQVDFKRVFTLLTEAGFDGWAVLEWECCVKSPEQGAAEGAPFISRHIIQATEVAFDNFAGSQSDTNINRRILGLD